MALNPFALIRTTEVLSAFFRRCCSRSRSSCPWSGPGRRAGRSWPFWRSGSRSPCVPRTSPCCPRSRSSGQFAEVSTASGCCESFCRGRRARAVPGAAASLQRPRLRRLESPSVDRLYGQQAGWGMAILKYGTTWPMGSSRSWFTAKPFYPPGVASPREFLARNPGLSEDGWRSTASPSSTGITPSHSSRARGPGIAGRCRSSTTHFSSSRSSGSCGLSGPRGGARLYFAGAFLWPSPTWPSIFPLPSRVDSRASYLVLPPRWSRASTGSPAAVPARLWRSRSPEAVSSRCASSSRSGFPDRHRLCQRSPGDRVAA